MKLIKKTPSTKQLPNRIDIDPIIEPTNTRDKLLLSTQLRDKDFIYSDLDKAKRLAQLTQIEASLFNNFLSNNSDITTQELGDYLLNNFKWKLTNAGRAELNLGKPYSYGKHKAQSITKPLHILLNLVNEFTNNNFNQIYCNYYENGSIGLGRHTDDEPEHASDTIACLSLGATREFVLRPIVTELQDDDLILFNRFVPHEITKNNKVTGGRISLTFREFN